MAWERVKNSDGKGTNIFNGIAFGVNIHLRAHVDNDFTYSTIQVHVNEVEYGLEDKVVCYFCFPRLGVAVPMRPGDFLLINALEYHCVSSRCSDDDDVLCLSCYLKTAVVGGNDNSRTLSEMERDCLGRFDEILEEENKERMEAEAKEKEAKRMEAGVKKKEAKRTYAKRKRM